MFFSWNNIQERKKNISEFVRKHEALFSFMRDIKSLFFSKLNQRQRVLMVTSGINIVISWCCLGWQKRRGSPGQTSGAPIPSDFCNWICVCVHACARAHVCVCVFPTLQFRLQVLLIEKISNQENLKFSCVYNISQEVEVTLWLPAINLKGKLNYLNLSTRNSFFSQDEGKRHQWVSNDQREREMRKVLNEEKSPWGLTKE